MLEWNKKFSEASIPVDVFWMDIPYTDDSKYFIFSEMKFPPALFSDVKADVYNAGR